MHLKDYYKKNISKFVSEVFACDCGKSHSFTTGKIIFETNAINKMEEFLKDIVPPLASVLLISDSKIYEKTNRAFEKKISRLGVRVKAHTFEKPPLASLESISKVVIPENCMLVIGIGGGTMADIAKFIAHKKQIPGVFILTSSNALGVLTPTSVLFNGGVEKEYRVTPFSAVMCDTNYLISVPIQTVASSYGEIVSKSVSVFDYKVNSILNIETFCNEIQSVAYGIIDDTLRNVADGSDVIRLTENSLKLSGLCQLTDSTKLISGGEVATSHVAHVLMRYEERNARLKGEREILLARVVQSLYQNFLASKKDFFSPPPDNNLRLECIEEFLGIPQTETIKHIRDILPEKKAKLMQYRLGEYSSELMAEASLNTARLARGFKTYKRLYPDDGFSLNNFLDSGTITLSIGLASDLKNGNSLLAYMKDMGLLDEYLLN